MPRPRAVVLHVLCYRRTPTNARIVTPWCCGASRLITQQITKADSSFLCANLSVLGVSAVTASLQPLNRRDAEDAEVSAEKSFLEVSRSLQSHVRCSLTFAATSDVTETATN
jgi:hypothetical protein